MNSLLPRRCLTTVVTAAARQTAPPKPKPKPKQRKPLTRLDLPKLPIPQVPRPRVGIKTPSEFLEAIGRKSLDKFSAGAEASWDRFFMFDATHLKEAGVGPRHRRYILWSMQQFRLGKPIDEFKHDPKKKKIRGWGPAVQNGKLLRSRRHQMPKKEQLKLTMHGPIMPPNQKKKLEQEAAARKAARRAARA